MKVYTIKLYFYGSDKIVPLDYKQNQLSFLHEKILKDFSEYHNNTSLYSFSPLFNSKSIKGGLLFKNGAIWLIRTPDIQTFKDIYLSAKNSINLDFGYGLKLNSVEFKYEIIDNISKINIGTSPIYLGQNPNIQKRSHITYKDNDELIEEAFKRIMCYKAQKMGLLIPKDSFTISFDKNNPIRTKAVKMNKSINITTNGRVNIQGSSDVIGLAYGFGLGLSTGCGFGFLFNINK